MPPGATPVGNVAVEGLAGPQLPRKTLRAGWSRPDGPNGGVIKESEIAR